MKFSIKSYYSYLLSYYMTIFSDKFKNLQSPFSSSAKACKYAGAQQNIK